MKTFRQGLGGKQESPPKEGDPHQGQEAWKKVQADCSRNRSRHCQDSNSGNRLQQTLKPVQPRRKSMEALQKAPGNDPASQSLTTAGA